MVRHSSLSKVSVRFSKRIWSKTVYLITGLVGNSIPLRNTVFFSGKAASTSLIKEVFPTPLRAKIIETGDLGYKSMSKLLPFRPNNFVTLMFLIFMIKPFF